jgi:hypothetical protein
MLRKTIEAVLFSSILTAVFSCSSSKITSSWSAENSTPLKKILLVGLISDDDKSLHSSMEKHIAEDLRNAGYKVEVLSEEYDNIAIDQRRKLIQDEVRKDTIDAILSIALLKKQKESFPVKEVKPANIRQDGESFWDYSKERMTKLSQPDYYITTISYYWETALFHVKDNRLVYIASTRSFDPADTEALSHDYGRKLVDHMKRKGVLR